MGEENEGARPLKRGSPCVCTWRGGGVYAGVVGGAHPTERLAKRAWGDY